MYRVYLGSENGGNRREHATEHLAVIVPILERLRIQKPPEDQRARAPLPSKTRLIISSRTEGAEIRLNGGAPEAAPASFEVDPGMYRVEVSAPSYITKKIETKAVEGTAVAFNLELDP